MNMFCSKCKQNPLPARDLTASLIMINCHVDIVDIKEKTTILLLRNSCKILCVMIFFHGNLMEFLTCLWKFCLIYGILAFSDGNSKFQSGSPGNSWVLGSFHDIEK